MKGGDKMKKMIVFLILLFALFATNLFATDQQLSVSEMKVIVGGDEMCDIDCQAVGDCISRQVASGQGYYEISCQDHPGEECYICSGSGTDETCSLPTAIGLACVVDADSTSCGSLKKGFCGAYTPFGCVNSVIVGTCATLRKCHN